MLVVCVAALFGVAGVSCGNDVITTAPTHAAIDFPENTNVKSLDALKEELRRNNDDYKDKRKPAQPPHRRALAAGAGAAPPAPAARPANPKKYSSGPPAGAGAGRNPKYVKKPVIVDRAKVDKLRSFLDEYKVIVNEFMVNRSETLMAPPRRQELGRLPAPPPAPEPLRWSGSGASDEDPVLRAETLPAGLDHRPPSGAQLDMSPARGGKVHSLRNKNRLCHRHVMIPEGPKYDSKGKVYLAEYERLRDRDYISTRVPKLLLPKCCNCCRKSVLGCE